MFSCLLQGGKVESMEVKDCPLELKELEGMECPRYTGVLKRGDTEVGWVDGCQCGYGVDALDY